MVVDVEARPVAGVLPTLLAHLDGSANLLEIAGDVEDSDHAEKKTNQYNSLVKNGLRIQDSRSKTT